MSGNLMLLLTALIWGTAFVAQSAGMDYIEPFTFGVVRNLIGGVVLIPAVWIFRHLKPVSERPSKAEQTEINRNSIRGGIVCGLVYCFAGAFQQYGISMTTAGKAGFITALYIVIVPLLGIFIRKKIPRVMWLCIAIAVVGFYLLCVNEEFRVSKGDWLVLCCAFFYSLHIMVIDFFNGKNTDGVMMSSVQFLVGGGLQIVPMLAFESPNLSAIWDARLTLFYTGVMSSGVAYTLQILAQRRTDPTTATLLMSLESVFAALSGCLILHESLSGKEILGCILVFAAVLLAQIPFPNRKQADAAK